MPPGEPSGAEAEDLAALRLRIGRAHLRHRLGLEGEDEARVFRMGWVLVRALLNAALTLAGLRGRGRGNTLRIEVRYNDVALAAIGALLATPSNSSSGGPDLEVLVWHGGRSWARERCGNHGRRGAMLV